LRRFDVQLIEHIFQQMPADMVGWLALVTGLAGYAALLFCLDPTRAVGRDVTIALPSVVRFETRIEFQKVMNVSLTEPVRASALQSMQARAEMLVQASDYAVNLLRTECAKVSMLILPPTFEPVRQLAREPATASKRRPLAA
jgi:hypothetical protein